MAVAEGLRNVLGLNALKKPEFFATIKEKRNSDGSVSHLLVANHSVTGRMGSADVSKVVFDFLRKTGKEFDSKAGIDEINETFAELLQEKLRTATNGSLRVEYDLRGSNPLPGGHSQFEIIVDDFAIFKKALST